MLNKIIIPSKLKAGDNIRIIAPSCSGQTVAKQKINHAKKTLENIGFKVTFGKHVFELNELESSSVKSRLQDLHKAFSDKDVKAVLAVRGGYNCTDLLDYIDWSIIKKNPKIYCGFSDNTALQNAILTKTGLITYSGPNLSTLGITKLPKKISKYTLDNFLNSIFNPKPSPLKNHDDIKIINHGTASGTIIGGNLCTLNLLKGTQYMPEIVNSILFIEDTFISNLDSWEFHRNLQSLINLPNFKKVKGLAIGKFQQKSKLPVNKIAKIIKTKPELNKIPVIANLNFGHNLPIFTFPVGGKAVIDTTKKSVLSIKF